MSVPCQRPNIYIIHRQGIFHRSHDRCLPYIEYLTNHYYYYDASGFTDSEYVQFYSILSSMNSRRYYEIIDVGWVELNSKSQPIPINNPLIVGFLQRFNERQLLGLNSPPPLYIPSGVSIFEITTIYE